MKEVCGWVVLRSRRDMRVFELENCVTYSGMPKNYPCFARCEIASDENSEVRILEVEDLISMLFSVKTDLAKK